MKEKRHWYKVIHVDNFYFDMQGIKVFESDKTIVLEFPLAPTLGGYQRVQFYKYQVEFSSVA